jgi:4,5-dihydroxyphthalate decarboxylase
VHRSTESLSDFGECAAVILGSLTGADMSRLRLTFACGKYDRTEALRTGEVEVEGVDLNYIAIEAPREIFDRMGGGAEFDAAEFSASEFIARTARGDCPFVALPVFPSRVFRHGYIYVNRRSGITTPKQLEGRRVGTGLYTQTATVWIRGLLADQYGVDLSRIRWVQGAVEHGGAHGDPSPPPMLRPVAVEINTTGRSLSELLAANDIDALAGAQRPNLRHADVVPLFADARAVERAYFRDTGIFPIMHLVAIRRDVHAANPWVAASLYKALVEAKNRALARMKHTAALCYMLPWLGEEVEEIDAVFGGDPWPYGVEANRATLAALVRYMAEQHLIAAPPPIEDLFVPLRGVAGR